jgi:hypothetical protein
MPSSYVNHHQTIIQRPSSSAGGGGRSTTALPPDLLDKARDRVKLIAVLFLGANLAILFSDVPAEGFGVLAEGLAEAVSWIMVLMSAGLYIVARSKRLPPQLVMNLALAFEIAVCLLLALSIPYAHYATALQLGVEGSLTDLLPFATWVTAIIILFPLIVPSPPAKTLWVAVVAAATVPLGLGVLEYAGVFELEPRAYPRSLLSPAIAVAIAYVGSRVVYSLGQEVTRARDPSTAPGVPLPGGGTR